jgi:cell division septal protein FtsQ
MRDYHHREPRQQPRNRVKKQRRQFNLRGIFRRTARVVGLALAGTALALLGFELYQFCASRTFLQVARINVHNNSRLSRDEVIALAGVKPGDDMLGIRLNRVVELVARNPWVEEVKVRRNLPETLRIEIRERVPKGIVNMGYLYYCDTKGEIFKPLNDGDSLDFPVITGITEEDAGRDPAGTKLAMTAALQLMDLLDRNRTITLKDVSEIHYDKGFGFTIFTATGGVAVRLGKDDYEAKLARLDRIFPDLQGTLLSLEYIDLDYPDKIIVKKA